MDEKKPRKKIHSDFSGMKNKVKRGPTKKKKRYGPFSKCMKVKPGMSEFQKKTMIKFMQVRDGETPEEWKKRTARRRVKEIDEIKELAIMHPLRIKQRKRDRSAIVSKNKYIIVQPTEREFDFMRYYGIVCNFYAIKHGIRKEDLEIGFYFYSNIPFTKDRFDNAAILMTGNNLGKMYRFVKEGLCEEVLRKIVNPHTRKLKYEKTQLFRLTNEFVKILNNMYRTLGKMNGIRIAQPTLTGLSPEVKQIIRDMNDHIQDIQTGRVPQEPIKTSK
jgi:hypothetical protein